MRDLRRFNHVGSGLRSCRTSRGGRVLEQQLFDGVELLRAVGITC